MKFFLTCALGALISCGVAEGAETDQYLTWDLELEDAGPALNDFLNAEADDFVAKINNRTQRIDDHDELVQEFYLHLFQGLHSSRIRGFLWEDPAVDRFPDDEVGFWAHQRMSIFRKLSAFPVFLPMARTVRLGDIYLGVDKIGHFFGFGRRYHSRYVELRRDGVPEMEAIERVIALGIHQESILVGGLVDGIFSHGDLEANYQGFRMARSLAEAGYFSLDDEGQWHLIKTLDILPFITPDMDESWNNSHFQRRRKTLVLTVLVEDYCDLRNSPVVRERFARYSEYEPSFSKQYVDHHFTEKHGFNPRAAQSIDVICAYCEELADSDQQPSAPEPVLSHIASAISCP